MQAKRPYHSDGGSGNDSCLAVCDQATYEDVHLQSAEVKAAS